VTATIYAIYWSAIASLLIAFFTLWTGSQEPYERDRKYARQWSLGWLLVFCLLLAAGGAVLIFDPGDAARMGSVHSH
jgi:hypothetical protein